MSFLLSEAHRRLGKENRLVVLNEVISWGSLGKNLRDLYKFETNGKGGTKPYDSLKMFKAILLGQWHNLSDSELEESLRVRLDFMMFTGLKDNVPDSTTLCRFRNRLVDKGLDEVLFLEIKSQLESLGLKIKNCDGAVIDATIIESASRPKKVIKNIDSDRDEKTEDENSENEVSIEYSKDSDAKWLKKGKKCFFGYKGFIATDSEDGYIENVHLTPANKSEMNNLENAIKNTNSKRVYADKGYASKKNREILKKRNILDGILYKASRNKPLSKWEKIRNKLISKKRFIVEQAFGTLKRKFQIGRSSYIGIKKVKAQTTFKAICFNLLKATNRAILT